MRKRSRMIKGVSLAAAATALAIFSAAIVGVGAEQASAGSEGLERFGTCEGFLRYVKRHASSLVGPYGFDQSGGVPLPAVDIAEGTMTEDAAVTGESSSASPEQDAGVDFSTTNVQEAGVDEPDIVKTDGSRIFALAGGTLYAVDTSGGEPRLVGSLVLPTEGSDDQLFLHGDRLLVLSRQGYVIFEEAATEIAPPYPFQTTLTEIDVSDSASMRIVRTLSVDGNLVAARLVGSTARLVVTSGPTGLEFTSPDGSFFADEDEAELENRQVIAASGVRNWVPFYRLEDRERGTTTTRRAVDCRKVSRPERFSGLGMLTVLTIDLERGLQPVDSDAVFAGGETVYASTGSLYVATQRYVDWSQPSDVLPSPQTVTTEIHRFDISRAGQTDYRSSGSVKGFLLGQFSMSENEGHLRVASTTEATWREPLPGQESESRVTVFAEQGDRLEQVGLVTGLGKGERIYAVRFMGSTGYVVTFRQVDPLYVLDLSDPTNPTVAGELKILGYSAYLHPVGDGLLLGIGQDATAEGQVLGTQVSLFDVSNPANPTLLDRRPLAQGWSEAEYDHHAFLWWPQTRLAVLPIQTLRYDELTGEPLYLGAAIGLEVGQATLSDAGQVTHPSGQIRRSLVIGQTLYTLSDSGLLASDLTTLASQAWVPFA
jgi:uncharacterized secreted protein with C-terminal beta-propeller domain